MKRRYILIVLTILVFTLVIGLSFYLYKSIEVNRNYTNEIKNEYNDSFGNLVNFVNSTENYLAKAMISKTPSQATQNLNHIWRDSNLALVYLSKLPIQNEDAKKTYKFLNQLSDYSYYLSKKTVNGENLSNEDFDALDSLYEYVGAVETTLNQLSDELYSGTVTWDKVKSGKNYKLVQEVDNISNYINLDQNLNNFEGLIYDGAYSDHVDKQEKTGLTGENITKEDSLKIVEDFASKNGYSGDVNYVCELANASIPSFDYELKIDKKKILNIMISKMGGHIVQTMMDREVKEEKISTEDAIISAKKYLELNDFPNMKETYFIKNENVLTINFAYSENNIVAYPDLIKVKVALDDGEVIGLETIGYLNSHKSRLVELDKIISTEEAKKNINEKLDVFYEGLAIIPTEWKSEVLCYEFKGNVKNKNFIVYVNALTGEEEEILVILETPGGTLTT